MGSVLEAGACEGTTGHGTAGGWGENLQSQQGGCQEVAGTGWEQEGGGSRAAGAQRPKDPRAGEEAAPPLVSGWEDAPGEGWPATVVPRPPRAAHLTPELPT